MSVFLYKCLSGCFVLAPGIPCPLLHTSCQRYKETSTLPGNENDSENCLWVRMDEDIKPFLSGKKKVEGRPKGNLKSKRINVDTSGVVFS